MSPDGRPDAGLITSSDTQRAVHTSDKLAAFTRFQLQHQEALAYQGEHLCFAKD